LTPSEYVVIWSLYFALLKVKGPRVYTRDVCDAFKELMSLEDKDCKFTSKMLNKLSKN